MIMKNLFYKLFCFLFLTSWGTMLYALLTFIAGLVGASETGAVGKILFIGIVWFGGFVLWAFGNQNRWYNKCINDKK